MRKFIFLLAQIILLSGCKYNVFDLQQTQELSLTFPQWPPVSYKTLEDNFSECQTPYPKLSRWHVQVVCAEYQDEFFVDASLPSDYAKTALVLSAVKNEPVAILATPITLNSEGAEVHFFKPAGMIYPFDNFFTWEGGFCATVFQQLFKSKKETGVTTKHMEQFLNSFNWIKFERTVSQKMNKSLMEGESFYNPWQIDLYTLLDYLSYGSFSASYLNTKNIYTIPLSKIQLEPEQGIQILSSFIPENDFIRSKGQISLKKGVESQICCNLDYAAVVVYNSAKNISLNYIFMPIFIE